MPNCPICGKEMIWQNDYDYATGEPNEETYTDYACVCGVMVTVPWNRIEDE